MSKAIALQITKAGGIQMLQDDAVDLREFGPVKVFRASHVEFSEEKQTWFVQSAKTGEVLRDDFQTRAEAIEWEKQHYAPGGQGWPEINQEGEKS